MSAGLIPKFQKIHWFHTNAIHCQESESTMLQMLLEATTYSINEISKIVGYDNQLLFQSAFHKLKGYPPREYRKMKTSSNIHNVIKFIFF